MTPNTASRLVSIVQSKLVVCVGCLTVVEAMFQCPILDLVLSLSLGRSSLTTPDSVSITLLTGGCGLKSGTRNSTSFVLSPPPPPPPPRSLSDTVTRSAIFCAVSNVMECCKIEGVVDVFQTVKILRCQRPGAIPSVVRKELGCSPTLEFFFSMHLLTC